jgi:hypothetical protein
MPKTFYLLLNLISNKSMVQLWPDPYSYINVYIFHFTDDSLHASADVSCRFCEQDPNFIITLLPCNKIHVRSTPLDENLLHAQYKLKYCNTVRSKGFWRWCITLGITGFLDFVQRPAFWRTQRFGNFVFFRMPDNGQSPKTQEFRVKHCISPLVILVTLTSQQFDSI